MKNDNITGGGTLNEVFTYVNIDAYHQGEISTSFIFGSMWLGLGLYLRHRRIKKENLKTLQ